MPKKPNQSIDLSKKLSLLTEAEPKPVHCRCAAPTPKRNNILIYTPQSYANFILKMLTQKSHP
jgi:hypothetical protein